MSEFFMYRVSHVNCSLAQLGHLDQLGHWTIVALVVIVPFGPVNFSDHWPIWDIGSTEPIEVGQTIQNRKKLFRVLIFISV